MNDMLLLSSVIVWMSRLAGLAALVNAAELLVLRTDRFDHGLWHTPTCVDAWGWWRLLLTPSAFRALLVTQCALAVLLMSRVNMPAGALAAGGLAFLTWLSAVRFRGNVNGGSDAMLFTVLSGLTIAQWPNASVLAREAGVLYVAAQVTLSYARAGLVKVRESAWWSGAALRAFVALPAYGVPTRFRETLQASPWLARGASLGVIGFECLAPLAWVHPMACLAVITVAVFFHVTTAYLFGLNRFLLAWGAALPSLWYAVHRVH